VTWIAGWLVSVIVGVFFNPLDSEEDKKKDFRGRLVAQAVINWVLWPWLLPAILERRKLYCDMRTGKRPNWIILADGEESGRYWTLSDGTVFGASVSGGSSSERSHNSADYEDETLTGEIEYRVRMVAPMSGAPTEWARLEFRPRGPEPDPKTRTPWRSTRLAVTRFQPRFRAASTKLSSECRIVPGKSRSVQRSH
jgi:hypothetical protein